MRRHIQKTAYHYDYIEPDIYVGKPREIPQRTDLTTCDADQHEKDVEGKVAELEPNDAHQRLAVTDDKQRDVEKKLSGLEAIEDMTDPAAKSPLAQIGVARYGILGAIVVTVQFPDDLTGKDC